MTFYWRSRLVGVWFGTKADVLRRAILDDLNSGLRLRKRCGMGNKRTASVLYLLYLLRRFFCYLSLSISFISFIYPMCIIVYSFLLKNAICGSHLVSVLLETLASKKRRTQRTKP